MPAQLTLIAGPPHSGKTERLLVRYRRVAAENPPGAAVWLAPTWRAAAEVRPRLLSGQTDGCFSPGVMTFEKFADAVLAVAPVAIRPLTRLMKRQLVRHLIDRQREAGRLNHFGPIAGTGGLVDLVCEFLSELKRLEIWPEQFRGACEARGLDARDVELAEIYEIYQQRLREHHLYDAEGRFWSARDWLQKGVLPGLPSGAFGRLRLVVADGFTDFTRTQHEILEMLAGRVDELLITLPLEGEPRRTDLFAKPLKTLDELKRRHKQLRVEETGRDETPNWPAMAHLERALFGNPRHARPADDTKGIEILAAARQLGEIELIGERIKRLLSEDGVKPGEIAVVFRSPQEAGSLIGEVFGALGIPVAVETGESLDRSLALRALAALLQLDLEDWPFGRLLAVLGSNYFRPGWPEWQEEGAVVAVEGAIRYLQVPRGRRQLLEQLERADGDSITGVAAQDDFVDELEAQQDASAKVAACRKTLSVLKRLETVLDALPKKATLADWGKAWTRLAGETGLLAAIEADPPAGSAVRIPDRLAWSRLTGALSAGDTLSEWLDERPAELDRRDALTALLDILRSERVSSGDDEQGQVRVLSAASVRALQIPYLFVAGLSEKAFPPPDREDRLYSEADYLRLIEEGLPLVARTERNREEMLLFYETITRAGKRLLLSYAALDEKAQPLPPSPYLKEVEQACGRIERTELTDLSPVPAGEPLSERDFRVKAVATALGGRESLLAGLLRYYREDGPPQEHEQSRPAEEEETGPDGYRQRMLFSTEENDVGRVSRPVTEDIQTGLETRPTGNPAENVLAGLGQVHLRRDRVLFSAAEGVLSGAAVKGVAAKYNFGRTFSATELESYATCPYRFFLDKVLKLKPPDDLGLAIDYLKRGQAAHEVLAVFHRRVNEALKRPASPLELPPEEFDRLLNEVIRQRFEKAPSNPVSAALHEVDRRMLTQWLGEYRRQCEKYDDLWKRDGTSQVPEFFEVSFGRPARRDGPPSTATPLEFPADGRTIRLSGRIDRIDSGNAAGTPVFNILDYKTGGKAEVTLDSVRLGTTLQLPIYAIAAAELLLHGRNPVPWQAGYWRVSDKGFGKSRALKMYKVEGNRVEPLPKWEEIRGILGEVVFALAEGMRRGEFPVFSRNEDCTGFCPFKTVCRINHVRSLEKVWQAPHRND